MITTNTGAKLLEGTDNWRSIFPDGQDAGAHNESVTAHDTAIANTEAGLAIVVNGDTAPKNITSGQYLFIKNHSTLATGGYHATAAISSGDTISSANVAADADGIANALNTQIVTVETTLSFDLTTSWVTGNPFNLPLPKAYRVTLLIHNQSTGDLGFLNLDINGRCRLNPGFGVQNMSSGSSVIINGAYQTE